MLDRQRVASQLLACYRMNRSSLIVVVAYINPRCVGRWAYVETWRVTNYSHGQHPAACQSYSFGPFARPRTHAWLTLPLSYKLPPYHPGATNHPSIDPSIIRAELLRVSWEPPED
ncbi:hypothetical protein D1007_27232 [Hordeum vulgare]|nr:hypothetical protein D1007_27232 [Hordeum vulgare]